MENLHVLRSLASLDVRLRQVELNPIAASSNASNVPLINLDAINNRLEVIENRLTKLETSVPSEEVVNSRLGVLEARPVVNLDDVVSRLAALEARPEVNLDDVVSRLAAVEARPEVNLDDVASRLSALESRPDVTQRLSALELTIASLNNS
jgi:hypothetical protein